MSINGAGIISTSVRWGRNLMDRQLFYHKDFSYSGTGLKPLPAKALSAHIGNWEISAARLNTITKGKTSIVRVIDDNPKIRELIERHMGDGHPEQIDPRNFMAASLQIRSALDNGHLVCMLGDRQLSGQAACGCRSSVNRQISDRGPFSSPA